jgi:hypothetical protein
MAAVRIEWSSHQTCSIAATIVSAASATWVNRHTS